MALTAKEKEKWTEELEKRNFYETVELQRDHIRTKNLYKNLARSLEQSKNEQAEENQLEEKEKAAKAKPKCKNDMEEIRQQFVVCQKERQQLRESSDELRSLERRLRAAYVNKERFAQMAQKENAKKLSEIQEKKAYELMRGGAEKQKALEIQAKEKEMLEKYEYRKELQDQMIFKEQSKRFQYEEFLREKKMIDDVVLRLYEEDEREIREKVCKMVRTREEMNMFKQAQQHWKEKEKRAIEEEDRKIQEFLMSKSSDEAERLQAKREKEAQKTALCDKIAHGIYEQKRKLREREDICLALMEEQQKDEVEARHKREVEKILRDKVNTRLTLKRQMQDNIDRQKREFQEMERYKEQLIKKVAEDERVELLSNQNRRRKMILVRKEVERMMAENKVKKAKEHELEMKYHEEKQRAMGQRNYMIKQERLRMLKEHAKNLLGYLPKGILEEADLDYLDKDVVDMYAPNYQRKPCGIDKD